jgi:hypothetical protein
MGNREAGGMEMGDVDTVLMLVAAYDSVEDAEADHETIDARADELARQIKEAQAGEG